MDFFTVFVIVAALIAVGVPLIVYVWYWLTKDRPDWK